MDYELQFRKLGRGNARRWILVVGLVAVTHLLFQSFLLPYGKALHSLLPKNEVAKDVDYGIPRAVRSSSATSVTIRNTLTVNASDSAGATSLTAGLEEDAADESLDVEDEEIIGLALQEYGRDYRDRFLDDGFTFENNRDVNGIATLIDIKGVEIPKENVSLTLKINVSVSLASVSQRSEILMANSSIGNTTTTTTTPGRKKMKCDMPPKTITTFEEMNQTLARHRAKSRAMRPRWSSPHDQEILTARALIEHAPVVKSDKELYAPIFRNASMFKKSYELMERTLKVYVYKEGEKPIFHQPILKGLYASEGWFMKLMEGNKQFTVKDPRRAHLFYMPFSSRMLEFTLYVRNSHNRTNLRQYLRQYSENIAAKYRFWNRTGGADHFLVACHDWAPYETRHHMERCMKALCNADVTTGFKIGRDVSLPETYVRSARNPLRDLGGKPPSQRHILAFYAGNLHGYLRPILLKHWKDRDPDMKIFGPMPPGVTSKMNYIQHMKSSKYCICPKGYEVNSPRVVEAIFYECVPVIISDNFVPPFFEVLNWEAFSIVLAEKDIPNLKDILLSIPNEKYKAMQLAVRKAQKHFLWHAKPAKYDLFHMTLHSIWYNRVFQLKPR